MQKIDAFFSLFIAKVTPIDRQVGSAGGTVMVTKSRLLVMSSLSSK